MMKVIHSELAPKAVGPYSQAIVASGFVFASGQLPIDPATGEFAEGGIKEQTRQSLTNVTHVLAEAHVEMQHGVFRPLGFQFFDGKTFEQFFLAGEIAVERGGEQGFAETAGTAEEDEAVILRKTIYILGLVNIEKVFFYYLLKRLNP